MSFLCSSRSFCASSRAFSAALIESAIVYCRLSIMAWIGPNAYRFRTNSAMKKQTIVQIISPGITEMSGFEASTYLTRT